MSSLILLVVAAIGAGTLLLFSYRELRYLSRGYQMRIGFEGTPLEARHVAFPTWRKTSQVASTSLSLAGIVLMCLGQVAAVAILAIAAVWTLVVGAYDVRMYGTLGAPSTWKSLVVLFALLALAIYLQRVGELSQA